jgi:membrane protein
VRHRLQRFAQFAVRVWRRFRDDGCLTLAGSLTYTALLSLVPLLTIALTLITAFPVFQEFTRDVDDFFARNMLPPAVAKTVAGYIEQFTRSAAGLTAAGIAALAVTAILLMLTIEHAFNRIWRVTRPRPLALRVLMYWGVLTLGPLLIGVSLTITSYVVTVSLGVASRVPGAGTVVLTAVPPILTAVAFTLTYLIVPNRPVRLLHAVIGGVVAALLFETMKRAFALYVAKVPTYALVYGAFAAVPIFLVWVYLSWVVTLLGAVIAALLPDYGAGRAAHGARDPATTFRAALDILRVLVRAQRDAHTLDTRRVLGQAGVSMEIGEPVLERLVAGGWVVKVLGQRWALACDPDVVRLADVYEGLVFDAKRGRKDAPDVTVDAILERAAAGAASAIDAPLRTLAAEPAAS